MAPLAPRRMIFSKFQRATCTTSKIFYSSGRSQRTWSRTLPPLYPKFQSRFSYDRAYSKGSILSDLIKPTLFTVVVVGGCLYIVNSEPVKNWNKDREKAWYMKRYLPKKGGDSSIEIWWDSQTNGFKTLSFLIGLNGLVFGLWNIPAFVPFMYRYFTHGLGQNVITMLTSCFSHMSAPHLLFNMIAMYSFGMNLHSSIGREQVVGMYIAGGVFSSWASQMLLFAKKTPIKSLGASGAIYGMVVGSVLLFPDSRLMLIFLPFISFESSTMLPVLIAFDTIGVIKMITRGTGIAGFDHAAHLGGAFFGYFYLKYLQDSKRFKNIGGYPRLDF